VVIGFEILYDLFCSYSFLHLILNSGTEFRFRGLYCNDPYFWMSGFIRLSTVWNPTDSNRLLMGLPDNEFACTARFGLSNLVE